MIYPYRDYHPNLDPTVFVAPGVHIIGNVTVGAESSIWFQSILRGDNAPIVIGDRTNIQDGCTLHVNPNQPVIIGSRVSVGHNVILHGCTVKDDALVGMGAIILDAVEIGEQAIVAAGSLIPAGKKIPPRTLVMGNPGKVVRELTDKDLELLQFTYQHYVKQSREYMAAGLSDVAE